MNNIQRVMLASTLANEIELFRDCDVVAFVKVSPIPESYTLVSTIIVFNYRIDIYNMNMIGKPTYVMDVNGLGTFQIM